MFRASVTQRAAAASKAVQRWVSASAVTAANPALTAEEAAALAAATPAYLVVAPHGKADERLLAAAAKKAARLHSLRDRADERLAKKAARLQSRRDRADERLA
jgi:hypothetical protein